MSEYGIEVFRAEAKDLAHKLTALILAETEGLPARDRTMIVGAALATVANVVDGQLFQDDGITGVVARCADMWRGRRV